MSWYQEPSITGLLGALGGATISAFVAVFIWRKTRKLSRVECAVDDPSSLLSFSSNISDKLEVKYDGKKATSVYLFAFEIANTGTEPIEMQPIHVQLSSGSHILDFSTKCQPEIGFGKIHCIKQEGNELQLQIALLNPGDRVQVEVISLNNPDDTIDIGLKNKGVESRVYTRRPAAIALLGMREHPTLGWLIVMSLLPIVGTFARALTTMELTKRVDRIAKK